MSVPSGYGGASSTQSTARPSGVNVSATHLKDAAHEIECDVLVCGDDRAAREQVVQLARDAGMHALHAGVLANSAAIEAMTSVLIAINKHYKVPASGLRITGVPSGKY